MLPKKLKIQDIKTGKIREITQYAHSINQKHGNDKAYMVLPDIDEVRVEKILETRPESIPTYDPYTNEISLDEFEEADIDTTPVDEYGYKISDQLMNEPIKEKKKRGRKSKNHNNE